MRRALKLLVLCITLVTVLGLTIAPASAGTCPIDRFIKTQSCW